MINIRPLEQSDYDALEAIHRRYYDGLDVPSFRRNCLGAYVIHDENNDPICMGGIKTFAEIVIVTDKSKSLRARREALYKVLDVSRFITSRYGYEHLHAFINDDQYLHTLLRRGFRLMKAHPVVIDLEN